MALDRAEIQRRYRERKKLLEGEGYMRKERERKRKYYVPTKNLSETEVKQRRKETLARVKKCLKNKKAQKAEIEKQEQKEARTRQGSSEKLTLKFPFAKGRGVGVRKRYKTALRNAYRKIKLLESQKNNLKKSNKTIQKRLERTRAKLNKQVLSADMNKNAVDSPRSATISQMKDMGLDFRSKEHQKVRKRLLFANALTNQVKQNLSTMKRGKLSLARLISGQIIKKYKCISELEKKIGITKKTIRKANMKNKKSRKTTKTTFGDIVLDFMKREDNCTILPGKKDTTKVGKEVQQKMILNDYLHNLHQKFCLENPEIKISRSVFCRLRPKNILLASFSSRAKCLCIRHQNMALRLRALRNQGANVTVNPDSFIACYGDDQQKIKNLIDDMHNNEVKFTEWKKVQDQGKTRCKQISQNLPKQEFTENFIEKVHDFNEHVARVKNQYAAMRSVRENLKEGQVMVWMDFAENFTCAAMEEVQSAYWNTNMVTLHTHVIYFPKSHGRSHLSIVGISSVLSHNASAVLAMIRKLVPMMKNEYPALERIYYLTDSPTSQYRNKTIFDILCSHQDQFMGIRASWDFLEAGHGKGPCDGLGASVKRSADMAVKQNKATIQSANDFFKWAAAESSAVRYFYVSQQDYDGALEAVKSRSSLLLPVSGTMKTHTVVPVDHSIVATRDISCHCESCDDDVTTTSCAGWTFHYLVKSATDDNVEEEVELEPDETVDDPNEMEYNVEEFVAVVYEKKWYVGQITDKDDDDGEVQIKFMVQAGKVNGTFKWEQPEQELWVPYRSIIMKINKPTPCGKNKRTFKIENIEVDEIDIKYSEWLKSGAL